MPFYNPANADIKAYWAFFICLPTFFTLQSFTLKIPLNFSLFPLHKTPVHKAYSPPQQFWGGLGNNSDKCCNSDRNYSKNTKVAKVDGDIVEDSAEYDCEQQHV